MNENTQTSSIIGKIVEILRVSLLNQYALFELISKTRSVNEANGLKTQPIQIEFIEIVSFKN